MLFGTSDLSVMALISALLHSGEDPACMRGNFYHAFSRLRFWRRQDRRPAYSRRRTGFGLPAVRAGQANPTAAGKPGRPQVRLRRWRENGSERRVTLSPQGIAFSRSHPPAADDPDLAGGRSVAAYPLVAETPGVYYVLSGAAAGRRLNRGRG